MGSFIAASVILAARDLDFTRTTAFDEFVRTQGFDVASEQAGLLTDVADELLAALGDRPLSESTLARLLTIVPMVAADHYAAQGRPTP